MNDLPENTITTNTMLSNNAVQFSNVNSTNLQDCIHTCCSKLNCNIAFYKESKHCYLISCLTEDSCMPVENKLKLSTDPVDYLVRIKSLGKKKKTFCFKQRVITKKRIAEIFLSKKSGKYLFRKCGKGQFILYSNFFALVRLYGTALGHGRNHDQNRSHVRDHVRERICNRGWNRDSDSDCDRFRVY